MRSNFLTIYDYQMACLMFKCSSMLVYSLQGSLTFFAMCHVGKISNKETL